VNLDQFCFFKGEDGGLLETNELVFEKREDPGLMAFILRNGSFSSSLTGVAI
jgi:hypothetical protein